MPNTRQRGWTGSKERRRSYQLVSCRAGGLHRCTWRGSPPYSPRTAHPASPWSWTLESCFSIFQRTLPQSLCPLLSLFSVKHISSMTSQVYPSCEPSAPFFGSGGNLGSSFSQPKVRGELGHCVHLHSLKHSRKFPDCPGIYCGVWSVWTLFFLLTFCNPARRESKPVWNNTYCKVNRRRKVGRKQTNTFSHIIQPKGNKNSTLCPNWVQYSPQILLQGRSGLAVEHT